jgi:hypothetical protein
MITAAISFLSTIVGVAITAAGKFRAQVPLNLLMVIAAATVSFALIPSWGLMGAATGMLASVVVQLLGTTWILVDSVLSPTGERPAKLPFPA